MILSWYNYQQDRHDRTSNLLGTYLKDRRIRLDPAALGFPVGRRRTPGLRREEVARLELQLAQQNVAVFQSQFAEGKLNLREVEKARLEENEKWMAYLDANFQKQQAQLELLKTAGQLDKVWQ